MQCSCIYFVEFTLFYKINVLKVLIIHMDNSEEKTKIELCDHCGENLIQTYYADYDGVQKRFCCHGCQSVYEILNVSGLTEFYELKRGVGFTERPRYSEQKFLHLDDIEFIDKYLEPTKRNINGKDYFYFKFFVEGIHCVACLWILEKLDVFFSENEILFSKLNMSSSILEISFSKEMKLSKIAKRISSLGYFPHAILSDLDAQKLLKKEDQKMLIKIGLAFAFAGNIMLYSLAVYAGADGIFKEYFNLFSFLCTLPVLGFCAIPFYQSAWGSLKTKVLSIDVPIVLALIIGMGMGIYGLIFKIDIFYFDTLSTLVFLLLLSRYILKKAQQKALGVEDLSLLFSNQYSQRKIDGRVEEVLTKFLKVGDEVLVEANETVSIDGVIVAGKTHINNSLLTGEVRPDYREVGDAVYMGAKNLDCPITVRVTETVDNTRLGKMLQEIEHGWHEKSQISLITDKIAKRFVWVIFILSTFFLIYFTYTSTIYVAFERTLSLLIITCPCALALTTPLALILGLSAMARNGVIIKNENTIEKLIKSKKIFLDKTGTLTKGDFSVVKKNCYGEAQNWMSHIYSMELCSKHPIASSIVSYIKCFHPSIKKIEFDRVYEVAGKGVEGFIGGDFFEIKKIDEQIDLLNQLNSKVGFFRNGQLAVSFELSDILREGISSTISEFEKYGPTPYILTGDNQDRALEVAKSLKIPRERVLAEKSPEQKRDIILKNAKSIMVGDGINDAIAMRASFVGIAVQGSVDLSLRAADVYLSKSGVSHILSLIRGSRFIFRIIHRNLLYSFLYNCLGVYLAFLGYVSPLVAAVLMPLSSITILISTVISTNKLNKIIKI